MFVYDFVQVDRPYDWVRGRVLADDCAWITNHAADAYREGEELQLRVGPRGNRAAVSKEVAIDLGTPRDSGGQLIISMSWKPVGLSALFPELDADLIFAPFPPDGCHLSVRGHYDPPLGKLGRGIDRLVLHRIAEASMRSFLASVSATLESLATAEA